MSGVRENSAVTDAAAAVVAGVAAYWCLCRRRDAARSRSPMPLSTPAVPAIVPRLNLAGAAAPCVHLSSRRQSLSTRRSSRGSAADAMPDAAAAIAGLSAPPRGAKLVAVSMVMRHGDRTPITGGAVRTMGPCIGREHSEFWARRVPRSKTLQQLAGAFPVKGHTASATRLDGRAMSASEGCPDSGRSSGSSVRKAASRADAVWPFEQLTTLGADVARAVGQALRRRFRRFGESLHSSRVSVFSSQAARAQHTAQWALLGMFPDALDAGAEHVPIAVPVGADQRLVIDAPHTQPERIALIKELSTRAQQYGPPPALVSLIRDRLQIPHSFGDNDAVDRAREVCVCHHVHGLDLPGGLSVTDMDALQASSVCAHAVRASVPELLRVTIGGLLRDMVGFAVDASKGSGEQLQLWSGHDSTMHLLLNLTGLHNGSWPAYCSAVVLEVCRTADGDWLLRLSYGGAHWCGADGAEGWLPAETAVPKLLELSGA